ncbi:MAG: hypothetical protein JST73_03105 [Actinobacteria bacterium]|nr:hypothetical protein [Actinomycetota bacterium]
MHFIRNEGAPTSDTAVESIPDRRLDARRIATTPGFWLVTLVLAPVVVAIVAGFHASWWPTSDLAIEYLRTTDVGTSATPLVGPYSRYYFNHPGPWMFYAFAPLTRTIGPIGMYVTTGIINAACAAGAVIIVKRRLGRPGLVLGGLATLTLIMSQGPNEMIDPWNPVVPVMPFFLAILCSWAILDGDVALTPWFAAATSFAVQTHIGYAPLVAASAAVPIVGLVIRHRRDLISPVRRRRKTLTWTIGVLAVFWLPAIIQQLVGSPGNLGLIWRSQLAHDGHRATMSFALHTVAGAMKPGAWIGPHPTAALSSYPPRAPVAWLIGTVGAALVLGLIAGHRGHPGARRLAVTVVTCNVAAVIAVASIYGPIAHYLILWLAPLAAATWLSIITSIVVSIRVRARRAVSIAAYAAVATFALALVPHFASAEPVATAYGRNVARLADRVAPKLSKSHRYLLLWGDGDVWAGFEAGFVARMESHGFTMLSPWNPQALIMGGPRRTDTVPSRADMILRVQGIGVHVPPHLPAGDTLIARIDPLDPTTRARVETMKRRSAEIHAENKRIALREYESGMPLKQVLIRAHHRDAEADRLDRQVAALGITDQVFIFSTAPKR